MQKKTLWYGGLIVTALVVAFVFLGVVGSAPAYEIMGEEGHELSPEIHGGGGAGRVTLAPVGDIAQAEYGAEGFVVVSEARLAHEECTSHEFYDLDERVCFFVCATDVACDQIEAAIDAEIAAWDGDYAGLVDYTYPHEDHGVQHDMRATYRVGAGEQITIQDGYDEQLYRDLWAQFARVADDDITGAYIGEYAVYDEHESDAVAYVAPLEDRAPQWGVYLNLPVIQSIPERDVTMTSIHEFAHIVTLHAGQVTHGSDPQKCTSFYTGEGCAHADAYIHAFVTAFWSQEDVDVVDLAAESGREGSALYRARPDHFVSDYAATNPGEDIAESFTHFILRGTIEDPQTVAEQKIAFFAEYPELVTMRTQMRAAIAPQRSFTRK